jgi:diguanylate cyclase (GGDEF)-like protein/PAS domain S-box-containing protein
MVWLKDKESRFLAVNAPFAHTFGWPSAEALEGRTDYDLTSRELADAYRADDRAVMASGEKRSFEEQIEMNGALRWFETFKSPVVVDGRNIGTVGFSRDITERRRMEAELRSLAATDSLTQLANRRHFLARLEETHADLLRDADHPVAVLMFDLDHFKSINDRYGHPAGDDVLKWFAKVLSSNVKGRDTVARYGGEEFAIVMPATPLDSAAKVAAQIKAQLEAQFWQKPGAPNTLLRVTASFGVAELAGSEGTSALVARADGKLYEAKQAGRNRVAA